MSFEKSLSANLTLLPVVRLVSAGLSMLLLLPGRRSVFPRIRDGGDAFGLTWASAVGPDGRGGFEADAANTKSVVGGGGGGGGGGGPGGGRGGGEVIIVVSLNGGEDAGGGDGGGGGCDDMIRYILC